MRARGLIFLAALLAAASAPAAEQVQSKRRELGHIQKELESTRREIDEFKKIEESLGKELQKIETRNGDARKRMDRLQENIRAAEGKKQALKSRLGALGQASGYWRGALESDVRLHAFAQASNNGAYGRRELWAEAFRRQAIIEKVELLAGLQGISTKTALAEAEARRSSQQFAQRRKLAEEERLTAQREYQQKKAAIEQTQEKVASAVARAKDLEETAKALTRLIRTLKEPRQRGKPSPARWDVPPHSLAWPTPGEVVKTFGRQRNPELNTWVINQGILLETPTEADVAAVRAGKVIFCGSFRSYGQVVILDHGSNFFSIYGDLGAILKQKGSEVRPGEVIARAGQSKSGRAGQLYLELRRGTEALDPMLWLKKR